MSSQNSSKDVKEIFFLLHFDLILFFQLSTSTSSISSSSSKNSILTISSSDVKAKIKGLFNRHHSRTDSQVVVCKRIAKIPILFLSVRK
jgi:hypothetical protein